MTKSATDYAWQPADPLGEAMHSMRLSGTFYCRSELTAPWGIDLPAMPDCLMFHVVTVGGCWLEFEEGEPEYLGNGDFALIPHGAGHQLKSAPGADSVNIFDIDREQLSPRYEVLRHGGGGSRSLVICGAVKANDPACSEIIELLPRLLRLQANTAQGDWLLGTIRLMTQEAQMMRPGGDTIITRVSDILVIQAIRYWLETNPDAQKGWLGALKDPQVGRAIAYIHRRPTVPWTVGGLADVAGMSRSGFAARFQGLVGESPMQYVRRWRFKVASNWLRSTDLPIAEMADQLGYNSEAAFNRAFKQAIGTTPGAMRRQAGAR